jgi:hypothetical protein
MYNARCLGMSVAYPEQQVESDEQALGALQSAADRHGV